MRFRLGLLIGFIAGFVVGARAGKERYDRLVGRIRALLTDDRVQRVTDAAERSTRRSRAAAGSGLVAVADTIRDKAAPDSAT